MNNKQRTNARLALTQRAGFVPSLLKYIYIYMSVCVYNLSDLYLHRFAVEAARTDTVRLSVLVRLNVSVRLSRSVCLSLSVSVGLSRWVSTGANIQDVNNAVSLGQSNRHHRWLADLSPVFKDFKASKTQRPRAKT